MNSEEKEISYTITNTYSTLNTITATTKNVWLVCHGMGYLSRYFLKYFKGLNPEENYIIAPQAQNKYYITPNFKHVGASWLTKENTKAETENVLNYFDTVLENENIPKNLNLIVFGYSQGVSIATRYLASRQFQCAKLILHSGSIPKELNVEIFAFYKGKIHLICGDKDEHITTEGLQLELDRAKSLFGSHLEIHLFDGVHEVNIDIINGLV
jgi:predicted esterase